MTCVLPPGYRENVLSEFHSRSRTVLSCWGASPLLVGRGTSGRHEQRLDRHGRMLVLRWADDYVDGCVSFLLRRCREIRL